MSKYMASLENPSVPCLRGFDFRQQRSDGGDFIRRVRVNLGMSQKSFADLLGVRRRQVLRWETGQQKPSWRVEQKVQKLLAEQWVRDILAAMGVEPFAKSAAQADSTQALKVGDQYG